MIGAAISLRQLRYICEVAESGSILASSKTLSISQSSIIAAIEQAEQVCGWLIFERFRAKGVGLTPLGQDFLREAQILLLAERTFERALQTASEKIPSPLHVGRFEPFGSLFAAQLIHRYRQGNDAVEVELIETNDEELADVLLKGMISSAITYDNEFLTPLTREEICRVPPISPCRRGTLSHARMRCAMMIFRARIWSF